MKVEVKNNFKKGRYKLDQIVIDSEDRLKIKYKIVKIFDKDGYNMYKAERIDKPQNLSFTDMDHRRYRIVKEV